MSKFFVYFKWIYYINILFNKQLTKLIVTTVIYLFKTYINIKTNLIIKYHIFKNHLNNFVLI